MSQVKFADLPADGPSGGFGRQRDQNSRRLEEGLTHRAFVATSCSPTLARRPVLVQSARLGSYWWHRRECRRVGGASRLG